MHACAHAVALQWHGTQVTNARLRHAQLLEGVVEVLRLLLHLLSNLHELLGGHVLGKNGRRSSELQARGREGGGRWGWGVLDLQLSEELLFCVARSSSGHRQEKEKGSERIYQGVPQRF